MYNLSLPLFLPLYLPLSHLLSLPLSISSPIGITLSQLSLSNSQAASLAYASNKLYITQFSSIAVYSFASDIATISSSSFVPIISVVRPTIPSIPPEEYRAVYAIFEADQPLPGN